MRDLAYNLLLFALDAAFLLWLRRGPARWAAALAAGGGAFVAVALAVALGGGLFDYLRLFAWAVFIHGPLVLAGTAVVLARRARLPAAVSFGVAAAVAALGAYAHWIEPGWLEITRVRVESSRLTRPVRILVLSDFQTDAIGDYERAVVRAAMAERPDLILMPGDYLQVDAPALYGVRENFRRLLREEGFGAPLGVYAVDGDVERTGWQAAFEGLPVTCVAESRAFDAGELRVTALNRRDSFNTRLVVPPADRFHIAFGHGPDFALGDARADLLVAGHTHGGQVRLPGIGPLLTLCAIPRAWAAGVTRLEGGRTLVVSRGIGMERGPAPRLRFLCRPELVVIDLAPPAEAGSRAR